MGPASSRNTEWGGCGTHSRVCPRRSPAQARSRQGSKTRRPISRARAVGVCPGTAPPLASGRGDAQLLVDIGRPPLACGRGDAACGPRGGDGTGIIRVGRKASRQECVKQHRSAPGCKEHSSEHRKESAQDSLQASQLVAHTPGGRLPPTLPFHTHTHAERAGPQGRCSARSSATSGSRQLGRPPSQQSRCGFGRPGGKSFGSSRTPSRASSCSGQDSGIFPLLNTSS